LRAVALRTKKKTLTVLREPPVFAYNKQKIVGIANLVLHLDNFYILVRTLCCFGIYTSRHEASIASTEEPDTVTSSLAGLLFDESELQQLQNIFGKRNSI
jgi:hypothetical protein